MKAKIIITSVDTSNHTEQIVVRYDSLKEARAFLQTLSNNLFNVGDADYGVLLKDKRGITGLSVMLKNRTKVEYTIKKAC